MTPALLTDTVSPDIRDAVDRALMWGLEAIALRTVGRERVPNANEARLRRVLTEAEMPVAWIDPGLFEGDATSRAGVLMDTEALREAAPFCRRLGCDLVAVGALAASPREVSAAADALRPSADVAQSLGLRLGVRNGASAPGASAPGASALAALVSEIGHPAVGALWSVAASREAGDDLAKVAAELSAGRVFGVEADEAFAEADPEASGLAALAEAGFAGPVVLAFGGVPERGLATSTALIRAIRRSV